MRFFALLALLLLTGCPGGSSLSPQDHANLWTCYAQLHGLSQSAESQARNQIPACFAFVDGLKTEGQ